MYSLTCELTKTIDRNAVIRNVVRSKPQGIAEAMFKSGADSGRSAAEEKCAANGSRHDREVNGFGLGSSVGRARPW